MSNYRLGIDVGGTFTDLVLLQDQSGEVRTEKVLTTPDDPSRGVLSGVDKLSATGVDLSEVYSVIHGTTLVANALIEGKGALTGLITTRGFRDVLHFVGRELRYDTYDPDIIFPKPLVPRALRREVSERVGGDGTVLVPLDEEQARSEILLLLETDVEAIAVCLLESYLHPEHELRIRQLILSERSDVPVSLSHEVLPQIREYERTSATVMNAFVQPLMHHYLGRLEDGLKERGIEGELYLMASSGGTVSRETAEEQPLQLVESGPAAGALVAAFIGNRADQPNILSFDMGGTTAKSAIIKHGRPLVTQQHEVARVRRFKKGSGLPVGIPVVDLLEIGAGGGSIAEIDEVGLLRVGPRSAGADPGPVCYGLGGTHPTVTDANLLLGFINPDYFLGGEMSLDAEAAAGAIEENLAKPLGLELMEVAAAIYRIVTENMAEAARVHSVEMNVDIRRYGVIGFGGAGPIHAYGVARRLGSPFVICPRDAGVLSALGLLTAPLAFEFARTEPEDIEYLSAERAAKILEELEGSGRAVLKRANVPAISFERSVDMHYVGQGYEVTTLIPQDTFQNGDVQALKRHFDDAYEDRYGRRLDDLPARAITWRVRASGPVPEVELGEPSFVSKGEQALKGHRTIHFPEFGTIEMCAVYDRSVLGPGDTFDGPAAVEEHASTVIVPPGATASVDQHYNIVFKLGDEING